MCRAALGIASSRQLAPICSSLPSEAEFRIGRPSPPRTDYICWNHFPAFPTSPLPHRHVRPTTPPITVPPILMKMRLPPTRPWCPPLKQAFAPHSPPSPPSTHPPRARPHTHVTTSGRRQQEPPPPPPSNRDGPDRGGTGRFAYYEPSDGDSSRTVHVLFTPPSPPPTSPPPPPPPPAGCPRTG